MNDGKSPFHGRIEFFGFLEKYAERASYLCRHPVPSLQTLSTFKKQQTQNEDSMVGLGSLGIWDVNLFNIKLISSDCPEVASVH